MACIAQHAVAVESESESEASDQEQLPQDSQNDVVQYLLISDRKKLPVKRAGKCGADWFAGDQPGLVRPLPAASTSHL